MSTNSSRTITLTANRNLALFEKMTARMHQLWLKTLPLKSIVHKCQIMFHGYHAQTRRDMVGGKQIASYCPSSFIFHTTVKMAKTTKRRSSIVVVCMYCNNNIGYRNRHRHLSHCTVWRKIQEEKEHGRERTSDREEGTSDLLSRADM